MHDFCLADDKIGKITDLNCQLLTTRSIVMGVLHLQLFSYFLLIMYKSSWFLQFSVNEELKGTQEIWSVSFIFIYIRLMLTADMIAGWSDSAGHTAAPDPRTDRWTSQLSPDWRCQTEEFVKRRCILLETDNKTWGILQDSSNNKELKQKITDINISQEEHFSSFSVCFL